MCTNSCVLGTLALFSSSSWMLRGKLLPVFLSLSNGLLR